MEYITERIVNIAELEEVIAECFTLVQLLQKESPQNENFQPLIENLKKASQFEFCLEKRKVNYCE